MRNDPYIQIWEVNRGWVVRVGCQEIIFTTNEKEKMVEAFGDLILKSENIARDKWCSLAKGVEIAAEVDLSEAPQTNRIR